MDKSEMYVEIKLNPDSKYKKVFCPNCDCDCTGMCFCPECDTDLD